jgi:hypothetical protein
LLRFDDDLFNSRGLPLDECEELLRSQPPDLTGRLADGCQRRGHERGSDVIRESNDRNIAGNAQTLFLNGFDRSERSPPAFTNRR